MFRTLFVIGALALAGLARAENSPEIIPVALDKGFMPIGFDDNDNSQVTVTGEFPATCYKVGPHQVTVDAATRKVYVKQTAYKYSGVCLRMVVPFAQTINLGLLGNGVYSIVDQTSGRELGTLPVTRSSGPEPDDYLYASVTDADVVSQAAPKTHTLTLKGTWTTRCMKLKEVRVAYHPEVIVVQPIAEPIGDLAACDKQLIRFSYETPLNPNLKGAQLLHVRSMNGQAINKIVDLP